METSRIKVKIGQNEFEAEGPTELVQSQFQTFKELVESLPSQNLSADTSTLRKAQEIKEQNERTPHVPLEQIMHVEGRVVSLTAIPGSLEDSALLILLGQRDMRNKHSATGQEVGDGLAQSGQPVERVDRILDKAIKEAFVMKIGMGRSTRYRLTNQGLQKALSTARELLAQLPS